MELATANAVFQSAMKIPAFVAKSILSCFLFLFACFLFLLIAPNLSKPAYAALSQSCRVDYTLTVAPGGTVTIGSTGFAAGEFVVLRPLGGVNGGKDVQLGGTPDTTTIPKSQDYTGWTAAPGQYNALVVTHFLSQTWCDSTATPGTNAVVTVTSPTPPASCNYYFDIPGGTVNSGGSVTVNVSLNNPPAASGDSIEAGFVKVGDPTNTPINQKAVNVTTTGATTTPITLTAPSAAGSYNIYAVDKAPGQGLCAINASPPLASASHTNNPITVGSGGGTGCNLANPPASTSWGTDLAVPTVSSYTATFSSGSHTFTGYGILIEDNSTGQVPAGYTSQTLSGNTASWTAPSTSTTYCAAVDYGGIVVSNVVTFTVPSAAGDTCSSSALNWVNDFRCRAIGGGWFDSDVFTVGQSATTLDSFNFMIWGVSPMNKKWSTNLTERTGALAMTGNMVASLYSAPPASGVQYFAQKIHDLNPVTPAYAAAGGIGYQTLGPVQKIWVAFRNIAYVGFIIVFVIMGFMIMFRAHISPQAVATVQDSIPRLVIALILVTFSYAIAGFMIDLMFLFLNIAIQALISTKLINNADYIFKDNVFTIIWSNWTSVFSTVATALSKIIDASITLPAWMTWLGADKLLGTVGGTLAGLVVGIAILFIMFRIFLMLLMAYVMIILLTMFAPFFFLIQAMPGNNGAKEWFRQMASNIAVFPTVALMFIFAGILGGIGNLTGGISNPAITPAQIGQFPLIMGNLPAQAIAQLIGIGFLLMTPAAADLVKNAMGGKGGGGGAMGAAAPAMAALGASAGFLGRRASESSFGQAASAMGKYGGERRTEWLINQAPGFMKGGNKKLQMGLPTLREREK